MSLLSGWSEMHGARLAGERYRSLFRWICHILHLYTRHSLLGLPYSVYGRQNTGSRVCVWCARARTRTWVCVKHFIKDLHGKCCLSLEKGLEKHKNEQRKIQNAHCSKYSIKTLTKHELQCHTCILYLLFETTCERTVLFASDYACAVECTRSDQWCRVFPQENVQCQSNPVLFQRPFVPETQESKKAKHVV